ncbi:SurA N-terminal domain-containing protein [Lichenihabitans psoromatis]|uniref:SurA N-terminal domain-containing protein n=1 Tax=Lichenihabitans psoromatis TaxID=2528642 RepID=UPI0010383BC3|nr:SurA N-terminal domain-containing protein [Lichenihabitans psoromatis]
MLESLRAIQNTTAGKAVVAVIMGLIMVSFVIWGIGPVFTGFNANQIASVGTASVTVEAFRQAYQNELQQLQQRARRQITNAQAHQYGIDTQVLSRLVSEAVLDNQTSTMGLSISDDQIAKAIVSDPTFKGASGQFDRNQFNAILRDNDMTEQMFVREQRNVYLRQELVQGLVGSIKTPVAAVETLHRFDAETRSIDSIVLPSSVAGTIPQPDDATLKKFFDDRAQTFRAPEYRKLVLLPLTPTALAKPDDVSDADVAKLYDSVKDARYGTPEYRTLRQIVFPSEAEAVAAAQAIKSGKSFADIATERKLSDKDLDLGRVTKASLFDKAVADAAFALPINGVSDPIKNAFGAAIVEVTAIDPATVRPLAEVAPALRGEIAASRAAENIRALHDKVEDARASGQSLVDAAKAAGLSARTTEPVDASGRDKDGKPIADIPDVAAVLKAAFASDVGVDNDVVRTPDGGQIFYEVAAIEPARAQSLDEVKTKVEAAWRRDETAKALSAKADALVKEIDGGTSIEAVAKTLGLPVQHVADVRRQGGTGLDASTVAQVFNEPVGQAASAAGEGDTRIVFKILGSVVPPLDAESPQTKQMDAQYQSWLAEDMLASYLTQVQGKIGVRINPTAYRAAIGSDS